MMQNENSKNDAIDQTSTLIFFIAFPLTLFGAFDGALNIILEGLMSFNWLESLFLSIWDAAAIFGQVEEFNHSEFLRNRSFLRWGIISLIFSLLISWYGSFALRATFDSSNSDPVTEEKLKVSQGSHVKRVSD